MKNFDEYLEIFKELFGDSEFKIGGRGRKKISHQEAIRILSNKKKSNLDDFFIGFEKLAPLNISAQAVFTIFLYQIPNKTADCLKEKIGELDKKFTRDQIIAMASNHSGFYCLNAALEKYDEFIAKGFEAKDIARMAANNGAEKSMQKVLDRYTELNPLFSNQQIVDIASHSGALLTIDSLLNNYDELLECDFVNGSIERMVKLVSCDSGSKNIDVALEMSIEEIHQIFEQQGTFTTRLTILRRLLNESKPSTFSNSKGLLGETGIFSAPPVVTYDSCVATPPPIELVDVRYPLLSAHLFSGPDLLGVPALPFSTGDGDDSATVYVDPIDNQECPLNFLSWLK